MGLIGGMAKTAVVAGTATAVSGRVSRRQANRWAAQQPAPEPPPQQYQQPPPLAYAPPPPPQEAPAADAPDMLEQLQKLGELRAAGVLTEDEFAAQKAKILAQ
jgi:hypothetical protein